MNSQVTTVAEIVVYTRYHKEISLLHEKQKKLSSQRIAK